MFSASLIDFITKLDPDSGDFSKDRKESLQALSHVITDNISRQGKADIIFICTHNSRRSQLCQAWARAASLYYGLDNISAYSGGTESSAFNSRAVAALERAGFSTSIIDKKNENPVYLVRTGEFDEGETMFSKVYDDQANPSEEFIAVMVCSDADEACPVVPGAAGRFSIPYLDPKLFDETDLEKVKYDETCHQIALEMFYLFSLLM